MAKLSDNRTKTAVEWLVKELNLEGYDHTVAQAILMEKRQVQTAFKIGKALGLGEPVNCNNKQRNYGEED